MSYYIYVCAVETSKSESAEEEQLHLLRQQREVLATFAPKNRGKNPLLVLYVSVRTN